VLLGLNKLWKLNLSENKLVGFAKKLGSDVPFFIYGCPFALAEAKGDEIKPLKELKAVRLWHVLAVPKIKVSTPIIYSAWDRTRGLTKPKYNAKVLTLALRKKDHRLIKRALFNGLEPVTARIYPELKRVRNKLNLLGLQSILMSGSGPAIFGIASSRKEAAFIYQQLKRKKCWRVFLTRTF
jgi:4-diphosphocytidyl-2-C-methyl-D-erythritol kinase